MKFIKNTFFLGLVLVAPAGITFWILKGLIDFFDANFWPSNLVRIPGMGLLIALAVIFLVGLLGKTLAGRMVFSFADWVFEHVPGVRVIYKLFNQISDAIFSRDPQSSFKKVVMVPFGSSEAMSMGFLVRELNTTQECVVFVPTAPNFTAGFILRVPKKSVRDMQVTVEEAFKIILSCGALLPPELPKQNERQ